MRRFRSRLLTLGAWLFWPALALVAWGELTPDPPPEAAMLWDKAEHFIAYFGLALLAGLGWGGRGRRLLVVFLAVALLGGALELLQLVTGRDAEVMDEVANALGAGAGTLLALLVRRRARLVEGGRPD
jgi:VanZ family protein